MEDVIEQLKKEMQEIDFNEPIRDENETIEEFNKRIQRYQEKMSEYQRIFETDKLVSEKLIEYKAKFISKFFDASNLRTMERSDYYNTLLMACANPEDRENYEFFSLKCTEVSKDNTKKLRIFCQIKNKKTLEKLILTFSDEDFGKVVDEKYIRDKIQNGMITSSESKEKKEMLVELAGLNDDVKMNNNENTSQETVKEFINKISNIEGVQVFSEEERYKFIDTYFQKLKILSDRKHKYIDIDFLRENLERNVKYIVQVDYTDEEKKLGDSIFEEKIKVYDENEEIRNQKREEIENKIIAESFVGESFKAKQDTGARPGQYIQGRIIFSNRNKNENILIDHETTHAARMEILDKKGEHICPNFDDLIVTTHAEEFLIQFPNSRATAGYDKVEIDDNGKTVDIENDGELTQLMEICTESIADMMNEKDEKTFEKFNIPSSNMSAITYLKKARKLLIMAIGSDDFIFDMLQRNTDEGYRKLNDLISRYKENASIIEYIQKSFDDDNILEEYATDIFLKRMESCQDKDKEEQINYFENILENEQVKHRVEQLKIKNVLQNEHIENKIDKKLEKNISKIMISTIELSNENSIEQDIIQMSSRAINGDYILENKENNKDNNDNKDYNDNDNKNNNDDNDER